MRATWYVLEDGSVVDPVECDFDDKGVLRHKGGVAVAKRAPDAYSSRGVDLSERQTEPEAPKAGYKTRQAKAKD
jgi:hypothetical protein